MKQKAYLVLSLNDINKLARVARRSAKASSRNKKIGNHCVVLYPNVDDHPTLISTDGEVQITDFHIAISDLDERVKVSEQLAGKA